jgi:NAD(P)-dependent dehydrogenase (short-subunit alcohol dehydrogenase family)
MARAFAAELGKHSVRVNSLHPGAVNTPMGTGDMMAALNRANETNPGLMNMVTPFLPDYIAQPEDISDAVAWLASDESRMVTAARIAVDLGATVF